MPTKSLSPLERLTFQTGSVVQVQVSNINNDDTITVSMKKGGSSNRNSRSTDSISNNKPFSTSREESSFKPWSPGALTAYNKNSKGPTSDRSTTITSNNKVASKRPVTPPGILLGTLKTGMNFTGYISSLTQYAAFIDINIYRKAKGDTYKRVNGMLHFSDVSTDEVGNEVVFATNRHAYQSKAKGIQVLDKGSPVTVYVKEVFKQAG